MEFNWELILGLCLGVGLSAACGLRVFLPLLVLNLGARYGWIHLVPSLEWLGSFPALVTFSAATLVEIAAYFIPYVDHLLDLISGPSATIAGTLVTASVMVEMDPLMRWSFAIIAGGGTAAIMRGSTASLRGMSTVVTGGLANPLVALLELLGSILFSLLAIFLPVLGVLLLMILISWVAWKLLRRRKLAVAR